jgi:hypothetical protein
MRGNVASTPHLRVIGSVVTFASLAVIALATLLPASGQPVASHFCLVCGALGGVDSILNVLLFVPLGVGLALYGVPAKRAILAMSVLSILIETAQLLVIPGRDATIGDVFTNTLGGAMGFAASWYTRAWLHPSAGNASRLIVGWAAIWLTIQAISGFAFAPSIPESQYYGQLAPSLGDFAVFQGRVLTARIDGIVIPNTALADSRSVQRLLLNGATVGTTLVPAEPTRDIAPVVRVADAEQREIVLLAQNDVDLLFAIHSGAAVLRLRPPLFALPQVFPKGGLTARARIADTIAASGRYMPREVRMSARSGTETYGSLIPLTGSLGWTLVLPWQWFIEGTVAERVISWIWVACLLLPLGYWAVYCARTTPNQTGAWSRLLIWPAGVGILYGGLALLPHAFGLAATPLNEWLAAVAGILLGGGLATWHCRASPRTAP